MALTPQQEAEALKSLFGKDLGKETEDVYQDYLASVGDDIAKEFKRAIKKGTDGSGALAQSIVSRPTSQGFQIEADFYYKFIDEGVNAAPKRTGLKYVRPLVNGSPYSFKNLVVSKGMIDNIRSIVGGGMDSVFAVAISIKKHGIKPKNLTESVLTDDFLEKIAEDLTELTGLAIDVIFETNGNNN